MPTAVLRVEDDLDALRSRPARDHFRVIVISADHHRFQGRAPDLRGRAW
jgi:hypothetical protein